MDNHSWVERAQQGDAAAFAHLVEQYQAHVYNLAYRMPGHAEEAEDAAHETFLRAFRQLRTYRPGEHFLTWLLAIDAHYPDTPLLTDFPRVCILYTSSKPRRRCRPMMAESLTELNLQPRQPLQTQVYLALRKAIVNGKLPPGSKLVEGQVAAQLGVSRNPVREALRKLEQDGLVVHNPNHGVTVSAVSPEQSAEIAVVREELEALSCRLAAAAITPADIADLRKMLADLATSTASGDLDELIATENGFHERLASIGGNATLTRILGLLRDTILRFRRAAIVLPGRPEEVLDEHTRIVDALEAGDAASAESLMRAHIRQASQRLRETTQTSVDGQSPSIN